MIQPNQQMKDGEANSTVKLVERMQCGDDAALDALLSKYMPALIRFAHNRMPWGQRTMEETVDIVQEAVRKSLRHLPAVEIRHDRSVYEYLRRAVVNRIVDRGRRPRRRNGEEAGEIFDRLPADVRSPLDAVLKKEEIERAQRAFAALKGDERRAIGFRIWDQLDYQEIANRLGKPSAAAARMAVTRAIARWADLMGRP